MSYRELRCFTETMKALGYPRLISLTSFGAPNFELVADCLQWLIHRFSPESTVADDIATESQRVAFLQAVAAITATKARTRLNLKRLYAADGGAVRELLKLASLLHKATHTADLLAQEDGGEVIDSSVTLKLLDASAATAAAREVVRAGPPLHDGVRAEPDLKDARLRALAAAQDSSMVEAAVSEALAGLHQGMAALSSQLSDTAASEAQLNARLDKWSGELERAEKRLATLASVRPAYMDEYEALTAQLAVLWSHYLERFRNLQYLEAQLDMYHRAEQEAADAAERRRKKLQRRLAEEELRILRGEAELTSQQQHAASQRRNTGSSGSSRARSAGGPAGGGSNSSKSESSSSDADDASPAGAAGWGGARAGAARRGSRGDAGAASATGKWGSNSLQQQQQQGGGPQVVGSLTAGWDAEDSLDGNDDDDGGSAGVLSHGGSLSDGAGRASKGAASRGPGAAQGDDDSLGDAGSSAQGLGASEDSGF